MKKIFALPLTAALLFVLLLPAVTLGRTGTATITPTTTSKTLNVPCIQTATEKRDQAIMSAWDTYAAAIKTALSTRLSAIKSAWAISVAKDRRAAIKTAWRDYDKAVKNAKKTMRAAKEAAWKQFRTDRRACGQAATSDDTSNSGADASL